MASSVFKRHQRIVGKILKLQDISDEITKLKKENKKIVLIGGCFDILHTGHILFLEAAKKEGDVLFVLLESDESIKKKKGERRPVNSQKNREIVVNAIKNVDYVVPLIGVTKNEEYDRLMVQIDPDIVAITEGDSQIDLRRKQCELINAQLKIVIKKIDNNSTTALINRIKK